MEDYNIQIIKYKDCNEILRTKILNTLFTCFSKELDPSLYDETILQILYYKNIIAGIVCGIDNYQLLKFNSPLPYHIENNKKGIFIYNLCIKHFFRKRGFARILLKLFLKEYNDMVDYFHVQIFSNNEPSLKIFESCQFTEKKRMNKNKNNEYIVLTR